YLSGRRRYGAPDARSPAPCHKGPSAAPGGPRKLKQTKLGQTASKYQGQILGTLKNYVPPPVQTRTRRKRWILWTVLISLFVLVCIAEVILKRAEPILKGRVIETLSTRF